MAAFRYIVILIKSWEGLELVSSLQYSVKTMLKMFAIKHTNTLPNLI